MIRKPEKVRLFADHPDFLVQRSRRGEHKPLVQWRSSVHLDFVRSHHCRYCGRRPGPYQIQACHLLWDTDGVGKHKPSDYWTWPGCPECHAIQEAMPEFRFHQQRGVVDPHRMCLGYGATSWCKRTQAEVWPIFIDRYGDDALREILNAA